MPENDKVVENSDGTVAEHQKVMPGTLAKAYSYLNNWGLRTFGGAWLNQYVVPGYPGIIPHKAASGWGAALFGHSTEIFEKKIGVFSSDQINQVRLIQDESIRKYAEENNGWCSFSMGPYLVIYVTDYKKSLQILRDDLTKIPLNEKLSGVARVDYAGILNSTTRVAALSSLMKPDSLFTIIKNAFASTDEFIEAKLNTSVNLSAFVHEFVEYLESKLLFDFNEKPLSDYTNDPKYHALLHGFLENIIDIRMSQTKQTELAQDYVNFMIEMLTDNFASVKKNKDNIFQKLYQQEDLVFPENPQDLGKQGEQEKNVLKRCLGIVAGASVNTSNALNWVIRHIENNPELKQQIIREAEKAPDVFTSFSEIEEKLSIILNVVEESLRFTPIVPGLGKLVETPHSVTVDGNEIYLTKNTFILVDVIACNRMSKGHFKEPNKFDVSNMLEVKSKQSGGGIFATLNNPNSMRSFGGGNNPKATSRCPGRNFSAVMQALMIRDLYNGKKYLLTLDNISLEIQNFTASQFHMLPKNNGTVSFSVRNTM